MPDICCAKLIYEANDVEVVSRVCIAKTDMEDANGKYEYQGVTTTDAYCDGAFNALSDISLLVNSLALLTVYMITL